MTQKNQPLVTIVVVPRESFNMAHDVVQRVVDVTTVPFKMIVMEGHAPEDRRNQLRAIAAKHSNIKIVYSDRWKFPHELVNESMPMIDTKYVMYLDNDVEIFEGCAENLVKTAEETGVDCVHPIYLTTKLNDARGNVIHVAEGKLAKKKDHEGKLFVDTIMTYSGTKLENYPYKTAQPSEFFEWHAVLFSKKLIDKGLGRLEAYELVQRNAMKTWKTRENFQSLLARDKDLGKRLNAREIKACFDLKSYEENVRVILKRGGVL